MKSGITITQFTVQTEAALQLTGSLQCSLLTIPQALNWLEHHHRHETSVVHIRDV